MYKVQLRHLINSLYHPVWILGITTILGTILRLYHLGYHDFWLDEAVIYQIANTSWGDIFLENATRNSAPPLYVILVKIVSIFQTTETALRSISAIAGICAIPAIYYLGKQLFSRPVGYLASLVLAIAPSQITYSQELREYSLSVLVGILIIITFYNYYRKPDRNSIIWLILVWSIAFWTQYGLVLLMLALNIAYLIEAIVNVKQRSAFIKWLGIQFSIAVNALLVIILSLRQQFDQDGFGSYYLDSFYWDGTLSSLVDLVIRMPYSFLLFSFIGIIFPLFFLIGLLDILFEKFERMTVFILALPFIVIFITALLQFYPFGGTRQNLFLTPLIYLVVAAGITKLLTLRTARSLQIVGVLLLIVMSGQSIQRNMRELNREYDQLQDAVTYIYQQDESSITLVVGDAMPTFNYYNREALIKQVEYVEPASIGRKIKDVLDTSEIVYLVFSHTSLDDVDILMEPLFEQYEVNQIHPDEHVHQELGSWVYRLLLNN